MIFWEFLNRFLISNIERLFSDCRENLWLFAGAAKFHTIPQSVNNYKIKFNKVSHKKILHPFDNKELILHNVQIIIYETTRGYHH
jgi:hypothetical protein